MRWRSSTCGVVACLWILAVAHAEQQPCYEFVPGLCPGPSNCMCTAFAACTAQRNDGNGNSSGTAHDATDDAAALHIAVTRLSTNTGGCAGACRQVAYGACPGGAFCLADAGPCVPVTPAPIVPPPPQTPSPLPPPSLVGMVPIPTMPGRWVDVMEAVVEYYGRSTSRAGGSEGAWLLHPFNIPLDALDANGTPYRALAPQQLQRQRWLGGAAHLPQAYISQVQASTACANAGKHLCTLAEYMASCSDNFTTYPYGDVYRHGYCNEGNPNPVITVYGNHATFNSTEMNNPLLDTLPHTLVPGGAFANCTNAVTKTFDMSGNLDEWVADRTDVGHGIFKGGYFVDASINGAGCHYMTVAHAPTYHDYSLGFRCCYTEQ